MLIGICQLTLRLHATQSLKAKRSIIKSLLARMQKQLNAGVAEIDAHDTWGKAVIALCAVSNSESVIRSIFRDAENMAEQSPGVEIIDVHISLL